MTRINLLPVDELVDQHLLAEYRELPRIFALSKAHFESGKPLVAPKSCVLGKGHVLFFYDKLLFLKNRQASLVDELLKRGFHINFTDPDTLIKGIPTSRLNDYTPTPSEIENNRGRIEERLSTMKKVTKRTASALGSIVTSVNN